jgi:dolichyl-phosphate beta-glucosyltransferase
MISVIVPAYNEEARLNDCLWSLMSWLHRNTKDYEILVVVNGCTDKTPLIANEWVRSTAHVRSVWSLPGKGRAVRQGMLEARGDIRIMADTDLSTPTTEFLKLVEPIQNNFADVVIGSREAPGSRRYNETVTRHLSGRVFNLIVQALVLPGISDTQCGFKAFSAPAAQAIFRRCVTPGWAFDVEALYVARLSGLKIKEVGVHWYNDPCSRVRLWHDSIAMLKEVIRIREYHGNRVYDRTRTEAA